MQATPTPTPTPGHPGRQAPVVHKKKPPYRICVCGPSYVGKTQLINRLVNSDF